MTRQESEEIAGGEEAAPETVAADEVTEELIRRRAYEISQGEDAGTPEENWRRAEQDVRGGGE